MEREKGISIKFQGAPRAEPGNEPTRLVLFEAVRELLKGYDLEAEADRLRADLAEATGELKPKKIAKRLRNDAVRRGRLHPPPAGGRVAR